MSQADLRNKAMRCDFRGVRDRKYYYDLYITLSTKYIKTTHKPPLQLHRYPPDKSLLCCSITIAITPLLRLWLKTETPRRPGDTHHQISVSDANHIEIDRVAGDVPRLGEHHVFDLDLDFCLCLRLNLDLGMPLVNFLFVSCPVRVVVVVPFLGGLLPSSRSSTGPRRRR